MERVQQKPQRAPPPMCTCALKGSSHYQDTRPPGAEDENHRPVSRQVESRTTRAVVLVARERNPPCSGCEGTWEEEVGEGAPRFKNTLQYLVYIRHSGASDRNNGAPPYPSSSPSPLIYLFPLSLSPVSPSPPPPLPKTSLHPNRA